MCVLCFRTQIAVKDKKGNEPHHHFGADENS